MTQTQYGFARTVCACADCQHYCRSMSGMCTPADLERWREQGQLHDLAACGPPAWLAASPGALVLHQGQVKRIPTIVPRRRSSGACLFLDGGGRCGIHDTAPYGCTHFDAHMSRAEADPRSLRALEAIAEDFATDGPYSQLWHALARAGQVVEGPETIRQRQAL